MILFHEGTVLGDGEKPPHGVVSIDINGCDTVDCLCLVSCPACVVTGKVPGGKAGAVNGEVLSVNLSVAVEGSGKVEGSSCYGLWQAVCAVSGY